MSSSSTSTSETSTTPEGAGGTGALREPGDLELEALADALAGIVTATSGVLRIEPTLRGAVQAWRSGDGDDPAQHLQLTVRGRMVDVAVHVAVTADHQARLLAHRLRERLQVHLTDQGLVPGTVEISILVIEPALS